MKVIASIDGINTTWLAAATVENGKVLELRNAFRQTRDGARTLTTPVDLAKLPVIEGALEVAALEAAERRSQHRTLAKQYVRAMLDASLARK